MPSKPLIIGLGSAQGDDALGWLVVDALSAWLGQCAVARRARSPDELLNWLDGIARLHVIDACHFRGEPGEIHRWDWPGVPTDVLRTNWSSHGLSVWSALALADKLAMAPRYITIWGIEMDRDWTAGTVLSRIEAIALELSRRLAEEACHA
jgi:hydrogenase maturation protease